MEVGAVALLDVARIDGVAASPSVAALVVGHVRDHVVVDGPSLFVRRTVGIAHFGAHQLYLSVDRNQAVRAQVALKRPTGGLRNVRLRLFHIRRFLDAPHIETDCNRYRTRRRHLGDQMRHAIAAGGLIYHLDMSRTVERKLAHLLESVFSRKRNPSLDTMGLRTYSDK